MTNEAGSHQEEDKKSTINDRSMCKRGGQGKDLDRGFRVRNYKSKST